MFVNPVCVCVDYYTDKEHCVCNIAYSRRAEDDEDYIPEELTGKKPYLTSFQLMS